MIGGQYDSVWTEQDSIKHLTLIGQSIITNELKTLKLPPIGDITPSLRQRQLATGQITIVMNGDQVWPTTGQHR